MFLDSDSNQNVSSLTDGEFLNQTTLTEIRNRTKNL